MTIPAGIAPAVYSSALADVRALRPYGTYQPKTELPTPTEDPRCGSRNGYQAHRRRGESACERCLTANATATRRRKAQQQTGTSKASA